MALTTFDAAPLTVRGAVGDIFWIAYAWGIAPRFGSHRQRSHRQKRPPKAMVSWSGLRWCVLADYFLPANVPFGLI